MHCVSKSFSSYSNTIAENFEYIISEKQKGHRDRLIWVNAILAGTDENKKKTLIKRETDSFKSNCCSQSCTLLYNILSSSFLSIHLDTHPGI